MRPTPNRTGAVITRAAVLIASLACTALPAAAHPSLPGITGYPALLLNPLITPHHALSLLAAMLVLFQSPAVSRWRSLVAVALMLIAANLAAPHIPNLFTYYWMAAAALIAVTGLAAALVDPVPPRLAVPLITLQGLLIGLDIHGEGPRMVDRLAAVSAALVTTVLLLLAAGFAGSYTFPRPIRILARIVAAWIAAAAFMIFAFALRG